jgi:GH43 family beta-xylosidase
MNRYRWTLMPTLICLFAGGVFAQGGDSQTYTNPIVAEGQDPWVVAHGGLYYYCYSTGRDIRVRVSRRLELIGEGEDTVLWGAPDAGGYSQNVWAPEMHRVGGRWYVYFSADDGENRNHRMYVLRSEGDDPVGPYVFVGKVAGMADRWAIDGTLYQSDAGELYFIWSGWPPPPPDTPDAPDNAGGDREQNLYIAAMSDPVTVVGEGVLMSSPTLDWEVGSEPRVNEGPEILRRGEKVHVIYSAGGSWTDDYCLGRLTLKGDDPLAPGAWEKHGEAVFKKTGEVFGPGHASFVRLDGADGDEGGRGDWIVYHAARFKGAGWDRDIRLQRFGWDDEGDPDFGRPIGGGVLIDIPQAKEQASEKRQEIER